MQLPVEVVDHIFSFLVSDRRTLIDIACSEDPVLFPMVERHFFHQITVLIPYGKIDHGFEPDRLFNLVSENPRILTYVRILEIYYNSDPVMKCFDDLVKTLLLFPKLECVFLWFVGGLRRWPDVFQATLKEHLNLSTVKKLHIGGEMTVPLYLFDHFKNIENLSITGTSGAVGQACDSTLPQLKSLTLLIQYLPPSLLPWLKLHTKELQSLECMLLHWYTLSELLGLSPGLNKLDVDVLHSPCKVHVSSDSHAATLKYLDRNYENSQTRERPYEKLTLIPPNLQQLTIRTGVDLEYENDALKFHSSYLPVTAKIINFFSSLSQHLVLDICINLTGIQFSNLSNLPDIDFSPLAVLGAASLSIPRIDLYVHTCGLPTAVILGRLMSSLEKYEGIMKAIEEGVVVIHSGMTAPACM